jgi:hypothetical protein
MTRRLARDELVAALFAAALAAALLAFAYIGLFARYMADDYCTARVVRAEGFFKPQLASYVGWTGRFAFAFVTAAAETVGPSTVPILPAAALACWLTGAVWAVYQVALLLGWPRPLLSAIVFGELVVFATLNGAHNIAQSLYWQSGMLTYTPPLILFTFFVAVACRGVRRRLEGRAAALDAAACGVLALVAGGFSEAYTLAQACLLLLALAACFKCAPASLRRAALPPVAAGLAGALLAGCVVWLAPGNAVRMSYFPAPPNLLKLIARSLFYSAGFIAYTIYLSPPTTLMSAALPALLSFHLHGERPDRTSESDRGDAARALLLPPLIGFALIFCCTVTAVYGTSGFLPERARLIPQFVLVCVAVWWGRAAGVRLSEGRAPPRASRSWRSCCFRRWPRLAGSSASPLARVRPPPRGTGWIGNCARPGSAGRWT